MKKIDMERELKICLKGLGWALILSWSVVSMASAEISSQELRLQALEEKVNVREGDLRVYYQNGLKIESANKDYRFQMGGRIMNDWAFFSEGDDFKAQEGDVGDGVEFRRARIYVSGLLYNRVKFKAQYDFAGQDVDFKDVYFGLIKLPLVGNLNIGHFKEPFSLEELTSSKYSTFMETSLANVFSPGRNNGFAVYNTAMDKRLTWAAGVFRPVDDSGDLTDSDSGYNLTARVTYVPWVQDNGRKLVHLGFGASYQEPDDDGEVRYRTRPESHQTDRFLNTDNFSADHVSLYGLEAALVYNSFSVQGEYKMADVNLPNGFSDPSFDGYYVGASYYLTGENRKYKKGAFGRTKVKNNFLQGDGLGAWQIALRYSQLDLNDAGIQGGEEENITVGLNWHLNNNTRVLLNYVHAEIENSLAVNSITDADLDILQMRFQIDF